MVTILEWQRLWCRHAESGQTDPPRGRRSTNARGCVTSKTPSKTITERARVVLLAAGALPTNHIAAKLKIARQTVIDWRRLFAESGPDALTSDNRGRTPGRISETLVPEFTDEQTPRGALGNVAERATPCAISSPPTVTILSPSLTVVSRSFGLR
jgi:hypothetical protein